GVSDRVHRTLLEPDGVNTVIDLLAGVDSPVHLDGDPRTGWMFGAAEAVARPRERSVLDRLSSASSERARVPNVDVGLAAFALAARMPPGSSKALFAVARSAGWLAHAREELSERPLRFRGRAV